MELAKHQSKILKTSCKQFDFSNPPFDPIEHAHKLVKCMYDNNGLGLSSNQVDDNHAVFCMRGAPQNFVCYNPRIVDVSKELVSLEEGCLSYPNLIMKIKRPKHIKVRFQTPNGETRTEKFTGMTARIFQHEMTHMRGEPFWKDTSRLVFDRALKKSKLKDIVYSGA